TNKIIKKYGAKVKPVTVRGMTPAPNEAADARLREIKERTEALRLETVGVSVANIASREDMAERAALESSFAEQQLAESQQLVDDLSFIIERRGGTAQELATYDINPDWYQQRLAEHRQKVGILKGNLEVLSDLDTLWEKVQEARALYREAEEIAKN